MLQLKNILCWIGDEEEHTLLEHSSSTREDEVTAEVMLGENQPYIAYWKYHVADVHAETSASPLRCKIRVRHGHLSRRCVGTFNVDPAQLDTLEGNSNGLLYGTGPLMTTKADKPSRLLGSVFIQFYRVQDDAVEDDPNASDSDNPQTYASFKFIFRLSGTSTRRKSKNITSNSGIASSSKRGLDSEDSEDLDQGSEEEREPRKTPRRIRKRPKRYSDSDNASPNLPTSSLVDLINDTRKLKNERAAIEKEECKLRSWLEERNAELREQIRLKRANLAEAKKMVNGLM